MNLEITGHTRLTCLLGHPVAHSISPKMHNEAFAHLGLDYAYLAFDVTPEQLPEVLGALRIMNFRGCNLTMPLKTAVIPFLDGLSRASELSGSVNTIVNEGGKLIGHTTDGIGYMDSLRDRGIDITGGVMTLLGAGGAAHSIITQAALDGVSEIRVAKRRNATFSQVCEFAGKISDGTGCRVSVFDMADTDMLRRSIAESTILTNATNVGMGDDPRSLVPADMLRPDLIVSDIIYHPARTPLLREAEQIGATWVNGLYMLLFQGAASFKLWTGEDMPIELERPIFQ